MVYIPHLMLLGTLYCCSNKVQKADKFYELVEIELTDIIQSSDKEFRDYMPVLYDISYKLMVRLYERHRDVTPPADGQAELMPEINIQEYLPEDGDEERDRKIMEKLTIRYVDAVFLSKSKLNRTEFTGRLSKTLSKFLQPHELRQQYHEKFLAI